MADSPENRHSHPARRWLGRIFRGFGWFLLLVVAWWAFIAARILSFAERDFAQKSDVIIVLGAAVRKGQPSPAFSGRIRHALELHEKGLAPKILFTGGLGHDGLVPEAEVASRAAQSAGVPAGEILTETVSTKTWENITEARRLMREHGLRSAIIVSDPFHLYRAQLMADDAGIAACTSPTPHTAFQTWRTKIPFLLNEVRLCQSHQIAGAFGAR